MIELPENPYPQIEKEMGRARHYAWETCQETMLRWFKERLNIITCISDSGDRDKALTSLIYELKAELDDRIQTQQDNPYG